jgi:hypothetical protein
MSHHAWPCIRVSRADKNVWILSTSNQKSLCSLQAVFPNLREEKGWCRLRKHEQMSLLLSPQPVAVECVRTNAYSPMESRWSQYIDTGVSVKEEETEAHSDSLCFSESPSYHWHSLSGIPGSRPCKWDWHAAGLLGHALGSSSGEENVVSRARGRIELWCKNNGCSRQSQGDSGTRRIFRRHSEVGQEGRKVTDVGYPLQRTWLGWGSSCWLSTVPEDGSLLQWEREQLLVQPRV